VPLAVILVACNGDSGANVSSYAPPDIHALQVRTFDTLWSLVDENYVYGELQGVNWRAVGDEYRVRLDSAATGDRFEELLDAMLAELPTGSAWLQSRDERIAEASAVSGMYEGIGSFVAQLDNPEPRIVLLAVMPDSPAERAGLQAHDAILAIDGDPVRTRGIGNDIVRVRGESGSDVVLKVRSLGQEPRDVVVMRGQIASSQNRLLWKPVEETNIAYFLFPPSDYEQLTEDFAVGLQALFEAEKLEAVILDLRIVTGGESWPAGTLMSLFTSGQVGELYTRANVTPVSVEGIESFLNSQTLPLAILVGPSTKGSAEIFAATMQGKGNTTVLGSTTPGDVETTSSFFLPDGSRAYVATSTFRTLGGLEVGLEGLVPDVNLAVDWDQVTAEEDAVIDAAVNALRDHGG
jgi:carboxyl-terminal processing protease